MKIKIRNRIISILLVLIMVLSLVPFASLTAFSLSGTGSENDPYIATTYDELKELMANAPTDGTVRYIKLGNDIMSNDMQNDYSLTLTNKHQNVVLDLAGKKITRNSSITVDYAVIRAKEGTLTINDSIGTGGVYAKEKIQMAIGITSTDKVYKDYGTIIINGGTFESDFLYGSGAYNEAGYLYINGGTFRGNIGLNGQAGAIYVYGGDFYTTKIDGYAINLAVDNMYNLYNLTAHGNIKLNSAQGDLWDYIPYGDVYVDDVKQSKDKTNKFVGNKIKIETKVTDEINISIAPPVVGEEMETTASVPNNVNYEIVEEDGKQVLQWFNGNYFASGTFEKLTVYKIRIKIKVNGATGMNICAKVNENDADLEFVIEAMEGYKLYWVEYTFPATVDNVLTSANVTIDTPVAGATATAGLIYTTNEYSVSIGWQTSTDDESFGNFNNKTFEAGATYFAQVSLVAEEPYEFADGATVFVNGEEYTSSWTVGPQYKKYIKVQFVEFTVPDEKTFTVSFDANGGTGTMEDVTGISGEYTLPENKFTAPDGKQFKAWLVNGAEKAVGDKITVTEDINITAVWEDIPDNLEVVLGDVTGDGKVQMDDVVEIQKAIAKLITFSEDEIVSADVNFDGKNTMEDVVTIQKYIAKLITSFDTIKNN